MKRVEEGIVFSNDIYSILKGVNALDFDYRGEGIMLPTEDEIQKVRKDFSKDVNRMFDGKVTIFSEAEMEGFLYWSLCDVLDYPHRQFR